MLGGMASVMLPFFIFCFALLVICWYIIYNPFAKVPITTKKKHSHRIGSVFSVCSQNRLKCEKNEALIFVLSDFFNAP